MWHATATCISGFRQSAKQQSGTLGMVREILDHTSGVYVTYKTWDDDMAGHAHYLHRMFPGLPRFVFGYSFGGQAAGNLTREMDRLNSTVAGVVLVDPVARRMGPWPVFRIVSAAWPWSKIRVYAPGPVIRVFHQSNNKPDGDTVALRGTSITLTSRQLHARHNTIDEHRVPHDVFLDMIRGVKGTKL